jgi:hypothetical protein
MKDGTIVSVEEHVMTPVPNAAIWLPFNSDSFEWFRSATVFSRLDTPKLMLEPPLAEKLDHHDRNIYQPVRPKIPGGWWFVVNNVVVIFSDNDASHQLHLRYMHDFLELHGLAPVGAATFGPWADVHVRYEPVLKNNELRAWLVFDMLHDGADGGPR